VLGVWRTETGDGRRKNEKRRNKERGIRNKEV